MNESLLFPPAGSPYRGPMTLGQILDRTFRLVRANLRLFVGIGVVPAVVSLMTVAAIEAVMMLPMFRHLPKPPAPEEMAHLFTPAIFIPLVGVTTVINGVIFALYLAAATYAATQADKGLAVSISEAWQQARSGAGRSIWLLFLIYVISFLPAVVIELMFFGGFAMLMIGHSNPNPAVYFLLPLGMLLFFAALVYGILIALRFSLAFPVCIVEGLTARAALKRSGQLTKGAKGRILWCCWLSTPRATPSYCCCLRCWGCFGWCAFWRGWPSAFIWPRRWVTRQSRSLESVLRSASCCTLLSPGPVSARLSP